MKNDFIDEDILNQMTNVLDEISSIKSSIRDVHMRNKNLLKFKESESNNLNRIGSNLIYDFEVRKSNLIDLLIQENESIILKKEEDLKNEKETLIVIGNSL